jgi:hypothetical protein
LLDILPRCVDRTEINGDVTRGIYTEQLTAVIGEGAYDEGGHRNTKFLEATGVGPYPGEMQRARDELRNEAAVNYGLEEDAQSEEARDKLGALAEPTPSTVRNRGAAERKKIGGVQAFMGARPNTARDGAREEGRRRGEGEEQQHREEDEDSEEDMEGLMDAVARAISQAEREHAETAGKAALTAEGAALTRDEDTHVNAR